MHDDPSWLEAAGRLLIVVCFLATGLCNLTRARIKDHIERMAAFHTPFPAAAFWVLVVANGMAYPVRYRA